MHTNMHIYEEREMETYQQSEGLGEWVDWGDRAKIPLLHK